MTKESKKDVKAIKVTLDDREFLNIKILLSKYGGTAPSLIRHLIMEAFRKEQGGYKAPKDAKLRSIKKKIEQEETEQITVEQYCEIKGGKLKKTNSGRMVCGFMVTPPNKFNNFEGSWNSVPLTKKDIDDYIKNTK